MLSLIFIVWKASGKDLLTYPTDLQKVITCQRELFLIFKSLDN